MLGELYFYLPKSFCSTNVYGEYTEGKNSIVGLHGTDFDTHPTFLSFQNPKSGFSLADRLRLKRPNSGAPVPLSLEVSGCEKFVMSHFAP